MKTFAYCLAKQPKVGYITCGGLHYMKLFGDAKVLRGSVAWTNPLRLQVTVLNPPSTVESPSETGEVEFDEDGRRYVFRYAAVAPQRYEIDRDRLFNYMRKHRVPTEGDRSYRRDVRNAGDFYEDVRDIQTHYDVEDQPHRLRLE